MRNIDKKSRPKFKKGMAVRRCLIGPGSLMSEEPAKILSIKKDGVWLDNGRGNSPSGPFDLLTGWHKESVYGTRQRIFTP